MTLPTQVNFIDTDFSQECWGEAVCLEYFQKQALLHIPKRKEPLYAATLQNCCLHLDFVLLGLTSLYALAPQNLSPNFCCLYCASHVTQSLPLI